MASSPEPTEAMVKALMRATEGHAMPSWNVMRDALSAALAVSPGCRGAELAEAAEHLFEAPTAGVDTAVVAWSAYVALRDAVAAFCASGEAGPDHETPAAEVRAVLQRWGIAGMFGYAFFEQIDERWNESHESGGVVG
jgi:hypothetical protein